MKLYKDPCEERKQGAVITPLTSARELLLQAFPSSWYLGWGEESCPHRAQAGGVPSEPDTPTPLTLKVLRFAGNDTTTATRKNTLKNENKPYQ